MALQTQVNFALLSKEQIIELCKKYGVNPEDQNAEVKINSIMVVAAKTERKNEATIATNNAHSVFEQYEAARGQRFAANTKYMDLRAAAEDKGLQPDSGDVKTAYNNFLNIKSTEQELDNQHTILAENALDKCFHAMG